MNKKQTAVKEKKADRFLGTKEDTAKGKYKSAKGAQMAKEIRKAMAK